MDQIIHYILAKQVEAGNLAQEVEARFYTVTKQWQVDNPESILDAIAVPLSQLLKLRNELFRLGGRKAVAPITIPQEISLMFLKTKTRKAVRKWYKDNELEMDTDLDDYIAMLYPANLRSDQKPQSTVL